MSQIVANWASIPLFSSKELCDKCKKQSKRWSFLAMQLSSLSMAACDRDACNNTQSAINPTGFWRKVFTHVQQNTGQKRTYIRPYMGICRSGCNGCLLWKQRMFRPLPPKARTFSRLSTCMCLYGYITHCLVCRNGCRQLTNHVG